MLPHPLLPLGHCARYVSGDFRFRNGYCRSNPRKMVKMWAEKEMRNLARLHAAGIPCPKPLQLRMHVLGELGHGRGREVWRGCGGRGSQLCTRRASGGQG